MKTSMKILKNRNEEIKLKFGVDRNKREYTWKKILKTKKKIESGLNLLEEGLGIMTIQNYQFFKLF